MAIACRYEGRNGSRLIRANPPLPTANAVLASGASTTSVGGKATVTASMLGDGASTDDVSRLNENTLLSCPPTLTLTGPLTASLGTSTTMEVGVTIVPST